MTRERLFRQSALLVFAVAVFFGACLAGQASGQDLPKDIKDRIDTVIAKAHQTAAGEFPCKVKTRGKPKMMRWESVDRCLNDAAGRVDWDAVSEELKKIKADLRDVVPSEFSAAVEGALSAHALAFEEVFSLGDTIALLPLTNSLLKFLPANSLQDVPVFDKAGKQVGTFSGVFTYERAGGLVAANTFRLTFFQYTDRNGDIQKPETELLLDSFGIPWNRASAERGFRLTSQKIVLGR